MVSRKKDNEVADCSREHAWGSDCLRHLLFTSDCPVPSRLVSLTPVDGRVPAEGHDLSRLGDYLGLSSKFIRRSRSYVRWSAKATKHWAVLYPRDTDPTNLLRILHASLFLVVSFAWLGCLLALAPGFFKSSPPRCQLVSCAAKNLIRSIGERQ